MRYLILFLLLTACGKQEEVAVQPINYNNRISGIIDFLGHAPYVYGLGVTYSKFDENSFGFNIGTKFTILQDFKVFDTMRCLENRGISVNTFIQGGTLQVYLRKYNSYPEYEETVGCQLSLQITGG